MVRKIFGALLIAIGIGLIGLGVYSLLKNLLTAGGAIISAGGFVAIAGFSIYRRESFVEIAKSLIHIPF